METLQRTGHLDPAALLSLPEEWQVLHIAHTRSLFIGRYDPQPATERKPGAPKEQRYKLHIAAAAVAQVRKGPRPEDIAQARMLLSRPGLPDHLRAAAQATLTRVGAPP